VIGSSQQDEALGIDVDPSGNVLITGVFRGTVDFDTSGIVDSHTAVNGDVFLSRFGGDGTYGWTRTWGGSDALPDLGVDVITNDNGDIYVAGQFLGSDCDFDFSSGTDIIASQGSSDLFVTKHNSDGSYGWTGTIGGIDWDGNREMALYSNTNVFMIGSYNSAIIDLDPTVGVDNHSNNLNGSIYYYNTFISGYVDQFQQATTTTSSSTSGSTVLTTSILGILPETGSLPDTAISEYMFMKLALGCIFIAIGIVLKRLFDILRNSSLQKATSLRHN